ncbi:MAG: DNA/RNA non-specific endonuclease [Phenylobacterium sp.]
MAQMPRGEPRSVPDPAGEQYDEMLRQERLKKAIAEADFFPGSESFSPNGEPVGTLPRVAQGLNFTPPMTPKDAPFSSVIPTVSPAELAQRRQAIDRAFYMADHPLAGMMYGLASLANASSQTRDTALAAGGAADEVMMGAAPFGAAARTRPTPPTVAPPPFGFNRSNIRYGQLNANGQATGASATIMAPMLRTGTRADRRQAPPGWRGNGKIYNEARGHLLGRQLGGRGDLGENLVTLTQWGANAPQMSGFERQVARRVRAGEAIEYSATPLYENGVLPPSAVLVSATGVRQRPVARLIRNPAGLRK